MDLLDLKELIRSDTPMHMPVVYNFEPCCAAIGGGFTNLTEYYLDVDLKLERQLKMLDLFPEALVFPGVFADFGVIAEIPSFGGRIEWSDTQAPYCHAALNSIEEVDTLRMPVPGLSGLTAPLIAQKKTMIRKLAERGEKLRRFSMSMGPAEIAGLVVGYENFFTAMYEDPDRVKKLMEMTTEFVIEWYKVMGAPTGGNDAILLGDHLCSQISPDCFEEFVYPYIKEVFNSLDKDCVKVYHNEGRHTDRHIELVLDYGADVWHFGSDVHDIKTMLEKVGDEIVLFGGLNPHGVLRTGTPEQVRQEALLVKSQALGHKLLFSSGTGTTPDTSYENMKALISVAAEQ